VTEGPKKPKFVPLTDAEVRQLLVAAMSYDNRKPPGQANVAAWSDSAELAKWTFDEALRALKAHYTEDSAFLMPGHITARIRKERQDRRALPPPMQRLAIEAPPAEPERIRSIIGGLAKMLGWQKPAATAAETLPVQCPYCHSLPGKPCVRIIGHGHRRGQYIPIQNPHQSRVDLMKEL
jgi:hypothetical protein